MGLRGMPLSVPSVACASVIDAPRADLSGSLCPRENNVFLVPRILQFVTLFHSIFFCLDSSVDCGILFAVQHITEFPNHPVEHSFAFFCLNFCQHLLSSLSLPPSPLPFLSLFHVCHSLLLRFGGWSDLSTELAGPDHVSAIRNKITFKKIPF